jgi:hypothetical protein
MVMQMTVEIRRVGDYTRVLRLLAFFGVSEEIGILQQLSIRL